MKSGLAEVSGALPSTVDTEMLSSILDQKISTATAMSMQARALNIANFAKSFNDVGGTVPTSPVVRVVEDKSKLTNTKPVALNDTQLQEFGNFAGTTDVNEKAKYLGKKGLVGASQLILDKPDTSTKNGVVNTQADWKTSAVSALLVRARKLGIRTPSEVSANKDALIGGLDNRIKQAITDPTFSNIHGNFWDVFNGVLKDQYDKENLYSGNMAIK